MSRRRQRGMTLMVAIFIVVIIASLAAFAVTAGAAARNSVNLQLQADRALAAARAGAEWGAFRALNQNVCQDPYPQLNLNQGALRGFRVTVRCSARSTHVDVGLPYTVVDIVARAQIGNFGAPDYAFREITVRYSSAQP